LSKIYFMDKDMKIIAKKYTMISPYLNEQSRRVWCGIESKSLGRGGISKVAASTGVSRTTIYEGIKDLENKKIDKTEKVKVRKSGGGRKSIKEKNPDILNEIELLVDPVTRGDPESPLLWTCKSTYQLSRELEKTGKKISQRSICDLLSELGYSLQAPRKTKEGGSQPDRDAQFYNIYETVKKFQAKGQPVISVDTKKKELIGEYKTNGREYYLKGKAPDVNVYDFIDKILGKVAPYGIYDQSKNIGFVNVGITSDTAEFAVESIRRWWNQMGLPIYKKAKELLITADCGGSNGSRNRLWKLELQKFAIEFGLKIKVCHFPPGTSKWNKIEHRMFSHITKNWRGKPLVSREVVVNLISNTTTIKGLKISAVLDENIYESGKKVDDSIFSKIKIKPEKFHGEWNYKINP